MPRDRSHRRTAARSAWRGQPRSGRRARRRCPGRPASTRIRSWRPRRGWRRSVLTVVVKCGARGAVSVAPDGEVDPRGGRGAVSGRHDRSGRQLRRRLSGRRPDGCRPGGGAGPRGGLRCDQRRRDRRRRVDGRRRRRARAGRASDPSTSRRGPGHVPHLPTASAATPAVTRPPPARRSPPSSRRSHENDCRTPAGPLVSLPADHAVTITEAEVFSQPEIWARAIAESPARTRCCRRPAHRCSSWGAARPTTSARPMRPPATPPVSAEPAPPSPPRSTTSTPTRRWSCCRARARPAT